MEFDIVSYQVWWYVDKFKGNMEIAHAKFKEDAVKYLEVMKGLTPSKFYDNRNPVYEIRRIHHHGMFTYVKGNGDEKLVNWMLMLMDMGNMSMDQFKDKLDYHALRDQWIKEKNKKREPTSEYDAWLHEQAFSGD